MCDLYPVFKSCCGISVRIALLYVAVLSIVTGAVINAALKKVGLDVASIDGLRQASDQFRALQANGTGHDSGSARSMSTEDYSDYDNHNQEQTTERPPPHHAPTTTAPAESLLQKVGSVNRSGLNLLAGGFLCLGVLLLLANFMRSPEMALVSVAATVSLAAASLALLAGVVGECAHARARCLLQRLDWFTSFCVTLFWFMYVFFHLSYNASAYWCHESAEPEAAARRARRPRAPAAVLTPLRLELSGYHHHEPLSNRGWLFFAGVANAFANGYY